MTRRKNKIKLSRHKTKRNDLSGRLKDVLEGLFYMSEIDAGILPFAGGKAEFVSRGEILRQTGNKPDAPVEERNFDEIFDRLTKIQDWYGAEEKAAAARFAALRVLLKDNLTDLKIFKIGRLEIDLYFVGLDREGNLAGIQTKALET